MVKIAVFDSGLGSLSVIKSIQKQFKCDIIYFADSKNFPYGKKSVNELRNITLQTISILQNAFMPELIIVGSNTLSLTLNSHTKNILTVLPPLNEAKKITKSNSIAILATESIVKSKLLDKYIKKFEMDDIKIIQINASPLVDLVEHGNFYSDPDLCKNFIRKSLTSKLSKHSIDVVILSSTHLPFLSKFLQEIFPHVCFIDPNNSIAKKIKKKYFIYNKKKNSLQIFTSGKIEVLEKKLKHLGIKNKISKFESNKMSSK